MLCSAAGYDSIRPERSGHAAHGQRLVAAETVIHDRLLPPCQYIVITTADTVLILLPMDHQGIESGGEKASVILYFYRGKWLTLQGAD